MSPTPRLEDSSVVPVVEPLSPSFQGLQRRAEDAELAHRLLSVILGSGVLLLGRYRRRLHRGCENV